MANYKFIMNVLRSIVSTFRVIRLLGPCGNGFMYMRKVLFHLVSSKSICLRKTDTVQLQQKQQQHPIQMLSWTGTMKRSNERKYVSGSSG